ADHPQTLATRLTCASIDAADGRIDAAEAGIGAVATAVGAMAEAPQPLHLAVLQARARLAEARGDAAAGLALRRDAMVLVESLFADGHPRRARAQLALAQAADAAGDAGTSRAMLAAAGPVLRAALAADSPTLRALDALAARSAGNTTGAP
ncbi:MAG: hypothetical protein ACK5SH_01710, partial [Pseudomonadota bacterium]